MEGIYSNTAPPDGPTPLGEFIENGSDQARHLFGDSDDGFFDSWNYKFVKWWLENTRQCTSDPSIAECAVGVGRDSETAAATEVNNPSLQHQLDTQELDVSSPRHAEIDGANVSPRPSIHPRPTPASSTSSDSMGLHPGCDEPGCIIANGRITAIRRAERVFASAGVAAYGSLRGRDRVLVNAYQVLQRCEERKIMAMVRGVFMLQQQMNRPIEVVLRSGLEALCLTALMRIGTPQHMP